jgi:hypothetical protein
VPTLPSDSITKANGIAAVFSSTTTLIGVVVGGLVMVCIFIWVVLYFYRRIEKDNEITMAFKDIYKVDSSSSSSSDDINISKGTSKTQGFQVDFQGEVSPKQRDSLNKLQSIDFEYNFDRRTQLQDALSNGHGENRPGSIAFDLANPMAGRRIEARKAHRPASNGLMNRFSAVFDYMETYLHRKSQSENSIIEIVESNPMTNKNKNGQNKDHSYEVPVPSEAAVVVSEYLSEKC